MHQARRWRAIVDGLILIAIIGGGCGSHSSTSANYQFDIRKISIETEPPGATVFQVGTMDGTRTLLGTTPIKEQSVAVTTGAKFKHVSPGEMQRIISQVEMVRVTIEKPGYQTYQGNLATQHGQVKSHSIKLEPTAATAQR